MLCYITWAASSMISRSTVLLWDEISLQKKIMTGIVKVTKSGVWFLMEKLRIFVCLMVTTIQVACFLRAVISYPIQNYINFGLWSSPPTCHQGVDSHASACHDVIPCYTWNCWENTKCCSITKGFWIPVKMTSSINDWTQRQKKHVPYVQNLNILKYKNLKLTGDNSEFEWNQSKAKEKMLLELIHHSKGMERIRKILLSSCKAWMFFLCNKHTSLYKFTLKLYNSQ